MIQQVKAPENSLIDGMDVEPYSAKLSRFLLKLKSHGTSVSIQIHAAWLAELCQLLRSYEAEIVNVETEELKQLSEVQIVW